MSTTRYFNVPVTATDQGNPRRVGCELEFAGLPLETIARAVSEGLGGDIEKVSEAEFYVHVADGESYRIELDWAFAKSQGRSRAEARTDDGVDLNEKDRLMSVLTAVAGQVVPAELVCPPLGLPRLAQLDPVVTRLRQEGALGTGESSMYAFGVHLNPEVPATDADTIRRYFQAFLLCQDWLIGQHEVDLTRRLTPYIDRFPAEYIALVLGYDDAVTVEAMMDDYVGFNPTRNRALDMLPLFRHLDDARLTAMIDDPRINARPTFHYRLPNCDIQRDGWTLAESWNPWCVVETLAEDRECLARLSEAGRDYYNKLVTLETQPWHPLLDDIYQSLSSA